MAVSEIRRSGTAGDKGSDGSRRLGRGQSQRAAQRRQLRHDLVEPRQQLGMPQAFGCRLLSEERDAASWIEDGALDLVQRRESLLACRSLKLDHRDELVRQ